jgi:hypothetical protein
MGRMDDLIARLGKINPATPRVHGGIPFNAMDGLGGVPIAANIDYRGFQAYMTPRQFLKLNETRDVAHLPITHIEQALESGESIGTPFMYADRTPDGWRVRGHEGRGRMTALQKYDRDALFPVAMVPSGEVRARHLTPEEIFGSILPDQRAAAGIPTRPDLVIWQQQPYVRPGQEENQAVLRALQELLPDAASRNR